MQWTTQVLYIYEGHAHFFSTGDQSSAKPSLIVIQLRTKQHVMLCLQTGYLECTTLSSPLQGYFNQSDGYIRCCQQRCDLILNSLH